MTIERWHSLGAGVLAFALSVVLTVPSAVAATMSFAVVVGNNQADLGDGSQQLQYADDDALRMHELFSALPGRAILLTSVDEQTRSAWPELPSDVRAPTVEDLERALLELEPEIRGAEAAGWNTAFYFFFAGHGNKQSSETVAAGTVPLSYLRFNDGQVTSRRLYELLDIVRAAERTHVLIDACNSLDLVAGRGEWADEAERDLRSVVGDFISEGSLRSRPDVGVFLSSTPDAKALESAGLRGGVYTHVLRSGLLGAADVLDAGASNVTYDEMLAFARTATAPSGREARRIYFFAEPPKADYREPLLDLSRIDAWSVRIPAHNAGRYELVYREAAGPYASFFALAGGVGGETEVRLLNRGDLRVRRWSGTLDRVERSYRLDTGSLPKLTRVVLENPKWEPGWKDPRDQTRGSGMYFLHPMSARVLRDEARAFPKGLSRAAARPVVARRKVVVMKPKSLEDADDVHAAKLREKLDLVLRSALIKHADPERIEFLSEEDIKGIVDVKLLQQSLGGDCHDGECDVLSEAAGALGGMDFLIHGTLGRVDSETFALTTTLLNRTEFKTVEKISADLQGAMEVQLATYSGSSRPIVEWFPAKPPPVAEVAPASPMEPWSDYVIDELARSSGLLYWGVGCLSASGAMGATAIGSLVAAQQARDDWEAAEIEKAGPRDRYNFFALATGASAIASLALGAAGAVLLTAHFVSEGGESGDGQLVGSPIVSDGQIGFGLSGRF